MRSALSTTISVRAALDDETAGVRENAVQLAEPRLAANPAIASRLVAMEHDPDARVRFSVLAALGGLQTPAAAAARDRMLLAHLDDRWMQVAALSAGSDRALDILEAGTTPVSPVRSTASAGRASLLEQIAAMVAAREKPDEIDAALKTTSAPASPSDAWWRAAVLRGLAAGARGHQAAAKALGRARPALLALHDDAAAEVREAAFDLLRTAGATRDAAWTAAVARAVTTAPRGDADSRADAIAFVSLDRPETRIAWFESFVTAHEPEAVQLAAVRALGRAGRGATSARWRCSSSNAGRDHAGRPQRGGRGAVRVAGPDVSSSPRCAADASRPGRSTSGRSGTW